MSQNTMPINSLKNVNALMPFLNAYCIKIVSTTTKISIKIIPNLLVMQKVDLIFLEVSTPHHISNVKQFCFVPSCYTMLPE